MLRLTTILRVRVNSITTNCNDVECLGSTYFHLENDSAIMFLMHEDRVRSISQVFSFQHNRPPDHEVITFGPVLSIYLQYGRS